jgi:hypothetical protein
MKIHAPSVVADLLMLAAVRIEIALNRGELAELDAILLHLINTSDVKTDECAIRIFEAARTSISHVAHEVDS